MFDAFSLWINRSLGLYPFGVGFWGWSPCLRAIWYQWWTCISGLSSTSTNPTLPDFFPKNIQGKNWLLIFPETTRCSAKEKKGIFTEKKKKKLSFWKNWWRTQNFITTAQGLHSMIMEWPNIQWYHGIVWHTNAAIPWYHAMVDSSMTSWNVPFFFVKFAYRLFYDMMECQIIPWYHGIEVFFRHYEVFEPSLIFLKLIFFSS